MKNAILIAILVLALSSCYTKRQCYDLVYRTDTISNTYRKDSKILPQLIKIPV